jgi:hypothetical protein
MYKAEECYHLLLDY